MVKRPFCALAYAALCAACVPDPGIKVPDFSVPAATTDLAPAADLASAGGDLGAAQWKVSQSGAANLRALWAADAALATVYAVGHDGAILRRSGGGDFAPEQSGTPENLYAVLGVSADEVFAVGAKGTILHRKGGVWSKEGAALGVTVGLYGLAAATGGDLFAVGDGGTVLRLSGGTWSKETSGTMANLRAASARGDEVFAVGAGGLVLRRAMGAWAADTAAVAMADRQNLFALALVDGALFAAGEYGAVLLRGADRWTAEATVKPNPMMGVAPHFFGIYGYGNQAAGEVFAVGAGGAIQRRAGGAWTEEKSGTTEDLSAVLGGGGRAVLAVGNKGTVARRQ